ncbi:MAG: 16S rRNA (cytosine(967)-C(5))-methyltransferase RsmB [bacterium]|nr:16S rRNA (cytosine(967)-C(5))-methyltransferase RsmB [bacterium]MBU1919088.1 16S rRNA (cytosine(967)-C(5))-methyltransferase RsmB [bacterium]
MQRDNQNRRGSSKNRLPISRSRYHLIPMINDLFTKRSFSGHKIDQTLKENHLSPNDRALFTELFYGFLRFGHRLLFFVNKFLGQPEKVPDKVKWILAVAFYQKLYLSKIPDHAIVNEAVEMTKHFIGDGPMSGLVNAVLKKFLDHYHRFENLEDSPLWVQTSYPEWMCDYLCEMWTPIKFFKMAEALNTKSPTYIRANIRKIPEEKLILKLKEDNITCIQTSVPNCLLLPELSVSPKEVPGYHEGLWTIQNMASQRIVRYLEAKEGDDILDACAGYGGKTLQLAEILRDKASIWYFDTIDKKMHAVDIRSQKMGFRHVKPVVEFEQKYNRVLIDAPCSGLGTISSHPEIKWFRTPEDLKEQQSRQADVMKTYSQYLLPGGTLLYAVCSIDKNEGEVIIKNFLAEHDDFELDDTLTTPFLDMEYGTYLLPTSKGESGYFISRLKRIK